MGLSLNFRMAKRRGEAGAAGSSRPKRKQLTTQQSLRSYFKPASESDKDESSTPHSNIVVTPNFYGILVFRNRDQQGSGPPEAVSDVLE